MHDNVHITMNVEVGELNEYLFIQFDNNEVDRIKKNGLEELNNMLSEKNLKVCDYYETFTNYYVCKLVN